MNQSEYVKCIVRGWEFNKTCYLYTWRDHRRYGWIINRALESKLIWYFTGVYIMNRILDTRLWTWILSSRVQRDISLVHCVHSWDYRVDHSKITFISTRGHVIYNKYTQLAQIQKRKTATAYLKTPIWPKLLHAARKLPHGENADSNTVVCSSCRLLRIWS